MLYALLLLAVGGIATDSAIYYDTYTGKNLTTGELQQLEKENKTFWCAGSYEPCDENEGRRMDETCNNLLFPYRGGAQTPSARDLPAVFTKDNNPVKTKRGEERPLARKVRSDSLPVGAIPDLKFTAMVPYIMIFLNAGISSIHDTINYIRQTKNCCLPEGQNNPICSPMYVPEDDTVHQFTNVRCMNMTKPLTYQNLGCVKNNASTPERINSASNFMDLSFMYGYNNKFRTMKDGLLQFDKEKGRIWPVSLPPEVSKEVCFFNEYPKETRCHQLPAVNGLIGVNFFGIMFWRLHNHIAQELKKVNPSWDDEKLFSTARDLNIAISTQIYYYELMTDLMGKRNLIRDGVIVANGGFRDIYNENLPPQSSTEYLYALRYGHLLQPGMTHQYDSKGNFVKEMISSHLSLRTGYLALDKNIEEITQGAFRQPMARGESHVVDPIISEKGFGKGQLAADITAADLHKGGLLGIASYVQYRKLCTGRTYRSFKDLKRDMDPENIEIIKKTQKDVEDIPLMLGLWLEKMIPGGHIPRTFYCLSVRQLKKFIEYDRHWYERPNRPNAFTAAQLAEVRKASIAWILCTVGDSVTRIQPKAFLLEGLYNRYRSCKSIRKINFKAWKDVGNSTSSS